MASRILVRICWPEAAYGLPEFCRARIPGARLIANPGCYPTAANLALRPLIDAGVIAREAGHRVRREIRSQRRGPQAVAEDQLLRSHRKFFDLRDPRASPCAGDSAASPASRKAN